MSYLAANNPHDWFFDTAMQEGLAESSFEDFALSIYDPFQGNVCAASSFIGLPVVATPAGPTGSDLSIILVGHKPKQQPPFTLIRPKSTLKPFLSPILQIAAPPLSSKDKADGTYYVFDPGPSPSEGSRFTLFSNTLFFPFPV